MLLEVRNDLPLPATASSRSNRSPLYDILERLPVGSSVVVDEYDSKLARKTAAIMGKTRKAIPGSAFAYRKLWNEEDRKEMLVVWRTA